MTGVDARGRRGRLLAVARGDAPPDLVLKGGRVVDVFGGEILEGDVAVVEGTVAGVGAYDGPRVEELHGAYVAPGFVDAHVHVESAMVPPAELGRGILPLGTTTVVTDPHEIANVRGLDGIRFMLDDARRSPLSIFVMAPSCVPASPLSTNGAALGVDDLLRLDDPRVLGLAEVMSFPAVIAGDEAVAKKIAAFGGRPVDGHAPGVTGKRLAAYVAAGPRSDHEATTLEEAREKLRAGMTVFVREATGARNLDELLPLVDRFTSSGIAFCTDDRTPSHIADEGHLDSMVRRAIGIGVDPVVALRIASLTAARHFGLRDRGAVAPGLRADLVAFRDLGSPRPHLVLAGGRVVARDGELVGEPTGEPIAGDRVRDTVRVDWSEVGLELPERPEGAGRVRAIGVVSDQLVTEEFVVDVGPDEALGTRPEDDLLRIAVVERHRGTGNVAVGLVRGLGLRRGALASTVAHDHHNLILAGTDATSLETAGRRAVELGGGLVVADGETVTAELSLPLAGLMSDRPFEEVARSHRGVVRAAKELGSELADPFMALSFLGLEVIPELKITDLGLVDVEASELVDLWVD